MKKKSRLLALLLTLAMVLTYMPALAFAEDGEGEGGGWGHFEFLGDGDEYFYSDGEAQIAFPDGFECPEGRNFLFDIGIVDGNSESEDQADWWIAKFSEKTYSIDKRNGIITLYGDKILDELPDGMGNRLWIDFIGGPEGDEEWLADGSCEFRVARAPEYDFVEDYDMLPGWDIRVDRFRDVWADNTEYPDYDGQYEVANVDVLSGNNMIRESGSDEKGWFYSIKSTEEMGDTRGTIKFKVTYKVLEGGSKSYTFNVNVTNTVYNVDFYADEGKWNVFPGESVTLIANGFKQTATKTDEGWWRYDETSKDLGYKWTIENDEGNATIKQDPSDPSKAVLTFKDMPAGENDYWVEANVRVDLFDNTDNPSVVRGSHYRDIIAETEFDRLEPAALPDADIDVGASMTITPSVKHYKMGETAAVVNYVNFSMGEYNEEAVDVQKVENSFKITRKQEWDTDIQIVAEWNDGKENRSLDQWYRLDRINYEDGRIRLEEDEEDWAHFYIIDSIDETMSVNEMKIDFFDEEGNNIAANSYNIEIGRSGWDEEKEEDFFEPVVGDFGITEDDKNVGFTQYTIRAVTKAGVKPRVKAEAEFFVIHKYSLEFFADISFAEETKGNWRMADRFWVDKAFLADPLVKSVDGKNLIEGQDYTITYYKRLLEPSDDPEVDRNDVLYNDDYRDLLSSRPSECGGYLLNIKGKGDYYGEYLALLDVTSEKAVSVQELIDALNTTTPDEAAVAKARAEYDKLSADEKALVDISKLTAAETKLASIKEEQEKAAAEEAARKAAAEKAAAELAEWNGVLNTKIPAAKSVKVKAAKKKVTVSWTKANKKNLKKFDTVEIQVCTDKKFDKANTIRKTVKKTKKSQVIKKLTSKKTYYVRVRDVKGGGATKQVSKWSKVKKVKVK